jgi:hypothetical protein
MPLVDKCSSTFFIGSSDFSNKSWSSVSIIKKFWPKTFKKMQRNKNSNFKTIANTYPAFMSEIFLEKRKNRTKSIFYVGERERRKKEKVSMSLFQAVRQR